MPRVTQHPAAVERKRIAAAALKLVAGLPDDLEIHYEHDNNADMYLLAVPDAGTAGELPGLRPLGVKRWMSLNRPPYYWMRPSVGKPAKGKLDFTSIVQSQLFLAQTGPHRFLLMLPLLADDLRATLEGHQDTLKLAWSGRTSPKPGSPELLLVAEGHEPYSLIHAAMTLLRERLNTFRLAEEKPCLIPDTLGWCTWDAFYHDVTADKVLAGLRSFREAQIPLGWCILDDGWLHHDNEQLLSFSPDPAKFPDGLGAVVREAKQEGLVDLFGIWHAFQGYWCGVNPGGELGRQFRTIANTGNIRPWNPDEKKSLSLIHPDDAARFYSAFHGYLREQGIDLVKIDGQSATEVFSHDVLPRVGTMKTLQQACQASALLHFGGRLIHCMCHSSDVLLNLMGTSLFRNSDDFFPNRPHSHGRHVFENALTAYWTHTVAAPDWDMFWSSHPEGAFHAAARAISGGPVYVSDQPGKQNAELLRSMLDDVGHVLMPERAGLPTIDSLFADSPKGQSLMVLTNAAPGGHTFAAAFNCMPRPEAGQKPPKPVTTAVSPADVPEYEDGPVVAYRYRDDTAVVLKDGDDAVDITLSPLDWEIVTFAPMVLPGVAALGLKGKMMGAVAITAQAPLGKGAAVFHFASGGTAIFYAAKKPGEIDVRGLVHHKPKASEIRYDAKRKRLEIDLPTGGECNVILRM